VHDNPSQARVEFDPGADPVEAFLRWFDAARGIEEMPEAAALATATRDGVPSARMVLWRGIVRDGFAFYTNYESRKARDLDTNPRASLLFHFVKCGRQVRVEGNVDRLTRAESEAYFATRPRESQLGAWASPQSRVLASRATLDAAVAAASARFEGRDVECPPHWGGYRLVPESIELWQQGDARLHDRMLYTRVGATWKRQLLAP
jgi:pyridoxamine 5'-phosphate oxidase